MAFIKDVWGGHDYIPRVWDEWLSDENGRMFVIEVDGVPVGMNRVRFTEDGEAWFEGVRVRPDLRGRGLASTLGENSMRVAAKMGAKKFRLTSSAYNKTAHRQIDRMGFTEASRISSYSPPKGMRFSASKEAVNLHKGDEDEALRLVKSTREYALGSGVFWHQFTAASLNRDTVGRLVAEGAVWKLGGAVAVTREGSEGVQKWRQACFVGGDPEDASRLLAHVFSLDKSGRGVWRFAYVAQGSRIITNLREKGYTRDFSLVLFEKYPAKG